MITITTSVKDWKDKIPTKMSGLYYFYVGEELVYIGKAIDIRCRMFTHFDEMRRDDLPQIDYDQLTKIIIVEGGMGKEREEIEILQPKWNREFNKSYKETNLFCVHCGKRHYYNLRCKEKEGDYRSMMRKMV